MSSQIRFISDCHFTHFAAIKFDNRPFNTVEEMDNTLIKNWNSVVKGGDWTYILGDFCWGTTNKWIEILDQLKGNKILIRGNHDLKQMSTELKNKFRAIKDYDELTVFRDNGEKQKVILSHYYMPFYNKHRSNGILLHGHSHITEESILERKITKDLKEKGFDLKVYNVGCMYPYMNFTPQTLESIITGYEKYENDLQK